ncbi:hypothetical protein Vretimale_4484 [Volvox reticuliferus]|uniref:F-box domain-containing protein n=1 Tax=Volvox reticuliferus TaxID=1737510 RepID=A0A8J4FFG0_9CHLO|nr:hypothetical protein Vretifemale_3090 [Volvox reticuliferus]GIL99261.1 hypothetical protein Vretimale_4484 [Volvox reticuliferus]
MEAEDGGGTTSWACLNQDILERIGCELSLREILSARLVCRQWCQYAAAAVKHLPHAHQHNQRQLVELDAQPAGRETDWERSLAALAACLPQLSEIMVYVSSRVSTEQLAAHLRSLPGALVALTKLELRYIVPSSVPCLGTALQQLQPSLTALTGLDTLYLVMGTSPEPSEVATVLPALSALRDLKLLSGLPQYGFTNSKLEALGCATQLQRLHLEVSGVGQVDAGLTALSRLRRLQQLWLDGLATLGPAVMCALQQLPELQELRLELDSPQHIPDLFALPGLKRLSLTYHGDELDEADDGPAPGGAAVVNNGPGVPVGGGGSSNRTDWDALERMVRGHSDRPVLCELGLLCCSFPADPLPRLALLTSLTSLTFYDCRWKGALRPTTLAFSRVAGEAPGPESGVSAAAAPTRVNSWAVLTSLVGLQGFGMAQCVVPAISESDLESLAAAWPGVTSLQLQSTGYKFSQLPLRPPPARFGAFLSHWRSLEALTLGGSWCNDPRVALDMSLLPRSLTSLIISSITLINSVAAKAIIEECLNKSTEITSLATTAAFTDGQGCSHLVDKQCYADRVESPESDQSQAAEVGVIWNAGHSKGTLAKPVDAAACNGEMNSDAKSKQQPTCSCACGQACSGSTGSACVMCSNFSGSEYTGLCPVRPAAVPVSKVVMPGPELPALEHLILGEVCLGAGVSLPQLVRWAPSLRSLEINNLIPNLTDDSCTVLAALTALTVLRVSQDQDTDVGDARTAPLAMPLNSQEAAGAEQKLRHVALSGKGLTALTSLKNLRQLEWLPWGCEPLDMMHVEALAHLRRLHLITLRGARDGAITQRALEALREQLPLCDIDDTEWSGLVDV